jgi:probable phosphoglycerate mutase
VSRLIIWRHGQTEWNATDRVQGHTDVGLDDVGRAQATSSAQRIAEEHPDVIISSDLRRAADTAAALAAVTGLRVRLDPRLREQYFGEWQGLTNAEVRDAYPDVWARWRRGEPADAAGIEEVDSLRERALAAVTEAAQLGGTVVVATHGGTAKQAMGSMLGWPPDVSSRVMGLMNCHWAEIQWHAHRGGWVLHSYNVGVVPGLLARSDRAAAQAAHEMPARRGVDSEVSAVAAGGHVVDRAVGVD